jgi:hypothetical protein
VALFKFPDVPGAIPKLFRDAAELQGIAEGTRTSHAAADDDDFVMTVHPSKGTVDLPEVASEGASDDTD